MCFKATVCFISIVWLCMLSFSCSGPFPCEARKQFAFHRCHQLSLTVNVCAWPNAQISSFASQQTIKMSAAVVSKCSDIEQFWNSLLVNRELNRYADWPLTYCDSPFSRHRSSTHFTPWTWMHGCLLSPVSHTDEAIWNYFRGLW